jgi:repressor LexA
MPRTFPPLETPSWAAALRERRKHLKLTQEDLAARTGDLFAQRSISNLETGRNEGLENLSLQRLNALSRALDWTLEELQEATGVTLDLAQPPPLLFEPNATELTDYVIRPIEALAAAAGSPEVIETQHSDVYIMPRVNFRPSYRFFTADGDSMVMGDGDGIHHGDTLIVDTALLEPREGEVFVVQDETGAVVVKRARVWNGEWWLTSDNPRYPPFQLESARILGIVKDAEGKRNFRRLQ